MSLLRQTIANIPVPEIAQQFGTPVYVYDSQPILQRIDDLRKFDVIRFAQKACSNLAILDSHASEGRASWWTRSARVRSIGRSWRPDIVPQGDPPGIVYTADHLRPAKSLRTVR
jgi:diaminopimelate decarboxylase